MTNGTASETNGIPPEITLLPCPFCGCEGIDEYEGDYGNGVYCMNCGAMMGEQIHMEFNIDERVTYEQAAEAWNTRTAVTDRDFAMAAHDGRTWVCVEDALESDALTPIPGFTRNDIYRDAMSEYGEWMEKATDLMRDMWDAMLDANPNGGVRDMGLIEKRLREFGIEVEDER